MRRGIWLRHALTVPYPTQLSLTMFSLLARIGLAMCLPNMWGAQSGVKKRTIWVPKPIVTNLLGPNLVGDQQAQT